jgi:hypothetical protein
MFYKVFKTINTNKFISKHYNKYIFNNFININKYITLSNKTRFYNN